MRKLLVLAAAAAVAMSSCSNDGNAPGTSVTSGKALSFSTFVEKTTRGQNAVLSTKYPVNGQFLTMAYNTGTNALSAASPYSFNYMRGVVTYDGSGYNYYPTHYWPETDKISFFAVHPADNNILKYTTPTTLSTTALPTQGLPVVGFTVNKDPLAQADLMMASAVDQTLTGSAGTVSFAFSHQLTRIGFMAKLKEDYGSKGDYIRIDSIVVSNVADSASFSFGNTGAITQSAPAIKNRKSFTLQSLSNMKNSGYVSSTTADSVNLKNSYLLMIPADYSSVTGTAPQTKPATITVTYDVECADGTKATHTITKLLSDFTALTGGGNIWSAGQAINYTMTISLTAVTFTAGVVDWTTPITTAALN